MESALDAAAAAVDAGSDAGSDAQLDADWGALGFSLRPGAAEDFGGSLVARRLQRRAAAPAEELAGAAAVHGAAPSTPAEELFHTRVSGPIKVHHAQAYLELFRKYVEFRGSAEQDFAMCYDFRQLSWPEMLGLLSHLPSIIRTHHALSAVYRRRLRYTLILISSRNVASLLRDVLLPLYTPVKPLFIGLSPGEAAAFVQSACAGSAPVDVVGLPPP